MRSSKWIVAGSVSLVALLMMWTPSDDGQTLCPFALATGTACPGCGMTRAMAWLVRGDLVTCVRYHPLAPLLAVIAVIAIVWQIGRATKGWRSPPMALANATMIGFGVLLIAVWATRLASGTLPPV
jgi:hypothetical protein